MHINHIMGLSGYVAELHQTSEGGACLDEVLESVEGMMYSVHFNELEPFTRYCVRLYPVNAKGRALKKDIQRSDRFVRTYPEGAYVYIPSYVYTYICVCIQYNIYIDPIYMYKK